MLRLISRLDIKNGNVIKGIHLDGQRHIGDPIKIAKEYYAQGIDEVLFMDSVASLYDRDGLFHMVAQACRSVFVPITMGGGIRTLADVERALGCGADKIAVNTALVRDPYLAEKIASVYGSQCLVGSIEAKKAAGGWEAYARNGREPTGKNVIEWAQELERLGVGELLVTSVDQEGTQRGFDIPLYQQLQNAVSIPIIASGGAGRLEHLSALDNVAAVQGIAIASLLHYSKASIDAAKAVLTRTSQRRKISHVGNN